MPDSAPNTTPNPVPGSAPSALTYYACGHTTHNLSQLMHGQPRERRVFPAGVFLYRHRDGRTALFDTGYGPATNKAGIKGFLYNLLLPAHITPDQAIDRQLAADGITPDRIDFVVLSHLHPDHIGGVRYFPDATFVLAAPMSEALAKNQTKEGVLPKLLPDWFGSADKQIIDFEPSADGFPFASFDLFGDDSFRLISLPGHARGHVGALVEGRVLLAADSSWGHDLMPLAQQVKALPRAINADWPAYVETLAHLRDLEAKGVRLCFSHDVYLDKDLLA